MAAPQKSSELCRYQRPRPGVKVHPLVFPMRNMSCSVCGTLMFRMRNTRRLYTRDKERPPNWTFAVGRKMLAVKPWMLAVSTEATETDQTRPRQPRRKRRSGNMSKAIPNLPAYESETGTQWWVWCRYCNTYHYHGPEPGHRGAHCTVINSPYNDTGYILFPTGKVTPEMEKQSERSRGRHILLCRGRCGREYNALFSPDCCPECGWTRPKDRARLRREGKLPTGYTAMDPKLGREFTDLCILEPQLLDLAQEAANVSSRGKPQFCANAVWYAGGLKERLCKLVGWDRKPHPVLGTEEAYDVAYDTCYNALPDCRDCLCFGAPRGMQALGIE